jgi:carbon-monoxide dehydrogenase medium subunit
MIPFRYERPDTLADAISLLREYGEDARVHAGGTDLLVGLRKGKFQAKCVIDLKHIRELDGEIRAANGTIRFGALTVMTDLSSDERVRKHFPALVDAASVVGSIQIRNRATVAGNICNASPAADTVPPLLVYGTTVTLSGSQGERRVPLEEFFVGPGKTVRAVDEIVTELEVQLPTEPVGASFARLTRRLGVDLATINLACLVDSSRHTRFGFGAVGPRPILVREESGRLAAADAGEDDRARVLEELLSQTSPISDVRSAKDYREAMLVTLSTRALGDAMDRMERGVRKP